MKNQKYKKKLETVQKQDPSSYPFDFSCERRYGRLQPNEVKKILVIQGSPRKEGVSKTDVFTKAFAEGCIQAGAEVDTVYLREKKINQCVGCFTCWTKTPGQCVFKDDVAGIMQQENDADLVILASPLYHYGIIALLKKYIERTMPSVLPYLIEREDEETTHPIREGYKEVQNVVIISVCGFPEVSHFGAFSANFHYLSNAGPRFNIIAEVYRPLSEVLTNPFLQEENDRVLNGARRAGEELITKGLIDPVLLKEIADVRLDKKITYEMANKSWDICIEEGITMPELQKRLLK